MAYSAYAVANAFIRRAEEGRLPNLTPMKLQKLMYFAQVWHLKVMRTPLLDDNFSRWQYGPVIPAIYHEFKDYGASPITRMSNTLSATGGGYTFHVPEIPDGDRSSWSLVDAVINRWGEYDGTYLSNVTHADGSAWAARGQNADGSVITWEEMQNDRYV